MVQKKKYVIKRMVLVYVQKVMIASAVTLVLQAGTSNVSLFQKIFFLHRNVDVMKVVQLRLSVTILANVLVLMVSLERNVTNAVQDITNSQNVIHVIVIPLEALDYLVTMKEFVIAKIVLMEINVMYAEKTSTISHCVKVIVL